MAYTLPSELIYIQNNKLDSTDYIEVSRYNQAQKLYNSNKKRIDSLERNIVQDCSANLALLDLSDVAINRNLLNNGDILTWNSSLSEFVNYTLVSTVTTHFLSSHIDFTKSNVIQDNDIVIHNGTVFTNTQFDNILQNFRLSLLRRNMKSVTSNYNITSSEIAGTVFRVDANNVKFNLNNNIPSGYYFTFCKSYGNISTTSTFISAVGSYACVNIIDEITATMFFNNQILETYANITLLNVDQINNRWIVIGAHGTWEAV